MSSKDPMTVRPLACVQALHRLHVALPCCPHTTFLSPSMLSHFLLIRSLVLQKKALALKASGFQS